MTLADRIEQAADGSRELDAEIARAIDPRFNGVMMHYDPHYTTSIDAAMTLVPEGWAKTIEIFDDGTTNVRLLGDGWHDNARASGETPALALSAAAIRAGMKE